MFFVPADSPFLCADQAGGWTPAALGPFWADFGDPDLIIVMTGRVTHALDRAGSGVSLVQSGSIAMPLQDLVNTCNGYASISLTSVGEALLAAAPSSIGHNTSFSVFSVCAPSSSQYSAMAVLGSGAHVAEQTVVLGTRQATGAQYWAGAVTTGSLGPLGGTVPAGTPATWVALEMHYAANSMELRANGVLVATGACTFNDAATFAQTLGIGSQASASFDDAERDRVRDVAAAPGGPERERWDLGGGGKHLRRDLSRRRERREGP